MEFRSVIEQCPLFQWTQYPTEFIFILAAVSIALCFLLAHFLPRLRRILMMRERRIAIYKTLDHAQGQNETFDMILTAEGLRVTQSLILQEICENNTLRFTAFSHLPDNILGCTADFFFRVKIEAGPIYYKFRSKIRAVRLERGLCDLIADMPSELQVGQKRNFFRMSPQPKSVRLVAMWLLGDNPDIPRTTDAIDSPFLVASASALADEKGTAQIQIKDISGSGLSLRLSGGISDKRIKEGGNILCLFVYNESAEEEEENLLSFCCAGRIANIRLEKKDDPTSPAVIGIVYRNWATIKPGDRDINWFSNSSTDGVGPILHWVTKMNLERYRRPGEKGASTPNSFLGESLGRRN
ncbi:MAG: hypothetical protein K6F46_08915 [Desulfovibrio sp.]|nr:hypothetical protein [Desulfovibrio sp.]